MAAMLTSLVLREGSGVGKALQLRPLVRMGQISYGMYLWHQITRAAVFLVLGRLGLQDARWTLFFGTILGVYLLSEASFRAFEQPFLRLKARFAS